MSFGNSSLVVLCPVYSAGEKKKYNFSEKYLSPLYNTIIKLFNLSDDKIGFEQAINIHWIKRRKEIHINLN